MADEPGGAKVIQLFLDSGVEVHVKPLSPLAFEKLRAKAYEQFPDPDEADYRLDPPEGVKLAIPGDKLPANQNPDYQKAMQESASQRSEWISIAVFNLTCTFTETHEALIERFAPTLAALREYIDLPDDAWEATLRYAIITSEAERVGIVWAAEGRLPLVAGEVQDSFRTFSSSLSWEAISALLNQPRRLQRQKVQG